MIIDIRDFINISCFIILIHSSLILTKPKNVDIKHVIGDMVVIIWSCGRNFN